MMHLSVQSSQHTENGNHPEKIIKPIVGSFGDGFVRNISHRVRFTEDQAQTLRHLAAEGIVIYALKNKSRLNSLLLKEITRLQGLPIPLWSMGEDPALTDLPESIRLSAVKPETPVEVDILVRDSAVLHLGSSRLVNDPVVEAALQELIQLQEKSSRPVFIVPLLISYGRRRDIQDESLYNILFGQYDDVGPIRRLITLIRYADKVTIIPSETLNLQSYLADQGGLTREDLLAREIRL